MGINQVQFQKGLSMTAFMEQYGTEEKCRAAVVAMRWPNGFVCPDCGESRHCTFERKGLRYWQCSACREQTRVMREREATRQLDGRVEIDDAYLGGQLPGGKSGRGSENKVSFIAAVQTTATGQPLRVCLKKLDFTTEAIAEWAQTALAASARVVSDGLWCFKAVTSSGASHERTVTGGGAACVKLEQFRAVNTFLGHLKTAYSGTYHAFDFAKYAHRYLAEVQYRFNRRFDLSSIMRRLLVASILTTPRPEQFLRAAEHCG